MLAEPGMNQRTKGGLAPKTIWNYYSFCSSVMGWAVKSELIDRNPCTAAAPKKPASHIVCLDDEQARQFLAALEQEPLEDKTFFTLALLTGYRRGELLGLEWPDVDLEAGVITVRRTSQYTNDRGTYTDTPKDRQLRPYPQRFPPPWWNCCAPTRWPRPRPAGTRATLWASDWTDHPRLFHRALNGTPMQPNLPGKAAPQDPGAGRTAPGDPPFPAPHKRQLADHRRRGRAHRGGPAWATARQAPR